MFSGVPTTTLARVMLRSSATLASPTSSTLMRCGPPQERVPRQIDLAHGAAAQAPLEDVLAQLSDLGLGLVGAMSRATRPEPGRHRRRAGHRHQAEQRAEDPLEGPQRLEGLFRVD